MEATRIETAATVLLREQATRRALVGRLEADSLWARFAAGMVLPAGTAALFLGLSAVWTGGPAAPTVVAVLVAGVFWLSLQLATVSRRLRDLTSVLQANGVLTEFIDGAARRGTFGSSGLGEATRPNTPLQPTSGGPTEVE